jgi:hypothetical protein
VVVLAVFVRPLEQGADAAAVGVTKHDDVPHFQMKTLKKVATETALHVLAYNLKRVMSIMGIAPPITEIRAWTPLRRKLRPHPTKTALTTPPAGR